MRVTNRISPSYTITSVSIYDLEIFVAIFLLCYEAEVFDEDDANITHTHHVKIWQLLISDESRRGNYKEVL